MELSKRDAVGDRFIVGPKKLANGSAPARQPALTGVNRSCAAGQVAVAHAAAGVEQELVVGGRQHVDVGEVVGDRERADQLRAVHENDRADRRGPASRSRRCRSGARWPTGLR